MDAITAEYVVGGICFGLSTVFGIRLRDDVTVPTAAALAPTAAALSLGASEGHVAFAFLPAVVAATVLLVAKTPLLEIASHICLFLAVLGALFAGGWDRMPPVVLALGLTLAYSLLEVLRQKVSYRGHAHINADLGMWWLLQAVLVCASGLTALVVERLGWPAFVAMAAVFAITKSEFEGFALSRTALDQTVRALDRLSQREATRI